MKNKEFLNKIKKSNFKELLVEKDSLLKELFNLKMRKSIESSEILNNSVFKILRKKIAQINTFMKKKY